ncbi:MAG: hypothetical protein HYR85_25040, partial [Planctomycetes bacterium]|nr:hypothetical protein [Planctomycetota bacterium]
SIVSGEIESRDALGLVLRDATGNRIFLAAADVSKVDDGAALSTANFTRYVDHGKKGAALETLDVTYLDATTGVRVTLVSAIHVADPEYYTTIQGVLEAHDRILFEGVGRGDGTDEVSKADLADLEFVDTLQHELRDLIGLTFQKDGIHYGGPKWRNADLSWPQVQKELKEKNLELIPNFALAKSLGPLAMKLLQFEKSMIAASGQEAMFRERLKRTMGGFLARTDEIFAMLSAGKEKWRDEVLVGSRNAAAIAALKDELEHKAGKSFAIFYGAAHMKDMEHRLVDELHFAKVAERWVTAWDIR